MPDEIIPIDDPRVLDIKISECDEPLVNVRDFGIEVIDNHPHVSNDTPARFSCRRSVAQRLVEANNSLDAATAIAVAEAHRPLSLQRTFWEINFERVRSANPEMSNDAVADETAKFVAPPWITPPHSTGGAVDVVLISAGREMPMGSGLNERCPEMATHAAGISAEERRNRSTLLSAMNAAGFVNYGHEWWHFSYGDRYWAYMTTAESAPFGGI
ncbi:M15 family metallopeptidase [Ilumatobacter nonamiensis]|uniref:M15 family metallopeptidase n=1 Tax=Ilumatobacter nonamiensis TaxID=467093 RepID=UPI00034C5260|nr:M15 family metallopeptidase [Ilumatobacter nonamiensis]